MHPSGYMTVQGWGFRAKGLLNGLGVLSDVWMVAVAGSRT